MSGVKQQHLLQAAGRILTAASGAFQPTRPDRRLRAEDETHQEIVGRLLVSLARDMNVAEAEAHVTSYAVRYGALCTRDAQQAPYWGLDMFVSEPRPGRRKSAWAVVCDAVDRNETSKVGSASAPGPRYQGGRREL